MEMTRALLDEPTDFSLVQGGPLFQLLLRFRLVRPSMDMLVRRIIVITVIAWVPLLVLTLLWGKPLSGATRSFLYDIGAHARFLLCVPLLVAAEVIVHQRVRNVVSQFLDRGIVSAPERPLFSNAIDAAMRLRNSVLAEALMLAIAIFGAFFLGRRYVNLETTSWFATPDGVDIRLTAAGYWYIFVSLTIFRFLLLRWYFRIFVWYRFLWHVSRHIPLQLNALHPDRAGGLAFLCTSVIALQPVLIAHVVALSGILGGQILNDGATLPQFKMEIAFWLVFLILLVLTPLLFFMGGLAAAKATGLREYGILSSRYVADFHRKWLEGTAAEGESLMGTADIQSLADLSNSFEVVTEMRVVPFGRATVIQLAMTTALPLVPLLLTVMPLEQLIDRALRIFI